MSVWSDIHRRSNGKQIRKEDEIINELESPADALSSPITYVGTIGPKDIANVKHTTGRLFYVNDDCSCNGQKFYAGDLIVDDGVIFHVVSTNDFTNSYIGQ